MITSSTLRLGRTRPAPHQRRKRASIAPSALPVPPLRWAPSAPVPYRMFRNNQIGDCTCANLANLLIQQSVCEGKTIEFTDDEVESFYRLLGNDADDGLVETDVLAYAEEKGFPLDGRSRLASVIAIDPTDLVAVRSLCSIFGGLYIGAELPARGQEQLSSGDIWSLPASGLLDDSDVPGTWGGHCMAVAGFSPTALNLATWGTLQPVTPEWWLRYVDECYVVLDMARITGNQEIEQLMPVLAAAVAEDSV